MNFITGTLLILTFSCNLWAGDKGNGGDASVCFYQENGAKDRVTKTKVDKILLKNRDNGESIDPLGAVNFKHITVDFFDLYLKRRPTLAGQQKLITSNLSYKDLVLERIAKIREKSSFFRTILKLQKRLPYEHFQGVNSNVLPIDDSTHVNLDEVHCSHLQLAVRQNIGTRLQVVFDQRLFAKMD